MVWDRKSHVFRKGNQETIKCADKRLERPGITSLLFLKRALSDSKGANTSRTLGHFPTLPLGPHLYWKEMRPHASFSLPYSRSKIQRMQVGRKIE